VHGLPGLGSALTHERHVVDIVIDTVNIGISMMNNIVFQFPEKCVAAKEIMCQSEDLIDPSARRKTPVTCIMHDIESDGCHSDPQNGAKEQGRCPVHGKEKHDKIDSYGGRYEYGCLEIKLPVAGFTEIVLLKIAVDR
jgi:hypothetical protein